MELFIVISIGVAIALLTILICLPDIKKNSESARCMYNDCNKNLESDSQRRMRQDIEKIRWMQEVDFSERQNRPFKDNEQ